MKTTTSQQQSWLSLREGIRIIWALFTKDVLEALKNKNTITVILTSLFIVFLYRALPGLSIRGESPSLRVYDAGNSRLISLLENSQNVHLFTYPSEEKMKQLLADSEVPELGLVIPDGFDLAIQTGETLVLQGYVLRWVNSEDSIALKRAAETEIANLLGKPVQINLEGNRVDMLPESVGLGVPASFGLAFVLLMIGVVLIPHLMLEEKQNRTLEVLAVSPASAGHIVAGKAMAGLFYCSLGGIAALTVNYMIVTHWWLALLTVLLGSLFTVSLGLWLGIKIESRAQLAMWSWVLLLPLIIPLVFSLLQGLIPDTWVRIAKIVPSAAIFDLARISFANPIPIGKTLLLLAWTLTAACLGLVIVAWILHRRDREAEVFSGFQRQTTPNLVEGRQTFLAPLLERIARLRPPRSIAGRRPSPSGESLPQVIRPRSGLDMIGIIAAKDLLEAFKNRLILSILLGSTFILLTGAALPVLLFSRSLPRIVVYDQGNSNILRALAARKEFRVSIVNSQADMEKAIIGSPDILLGLVLPADFDRQAREGQAIELQTYYPHWVELTKLSQRATLFEEQFRQASRAPVKLDLAGHAVYPTKNLSGQPLILLLNLVVVILIIGIALVPLLMIEEKEAKTLSVLLVSPASLRQVILGKALVGLFYSFLPALVVMLVSHRLFVHWEVAFLAVLLTASLAVEIGLLLGIISDSPTNVSMWGSLILLLLIGSALLKMFTRLNLPPAVQSLADWLPGSAMLQLFSISQAGEVPIGLLWLNASALLAVIAVIAILLAWLIRRTER